MCKKRGRMRDPEGFSSPTLLTASPSCLESGLGQVPLYILRSFYSRMVLWVESGTWPNLDLRRVGVRPTKAPRALQCNVLGSYSPLPPLLTTSLPDISFLPSLYPPLFMGLQNMHMGGGQRPTLWWSLGSVIFIIRGMVAP